MQDWSIAFANLCEGDRWGDQNFRITRRRLESITANLALANVGFAELPTTPDRKGAFRGF